MPKTSTAITKKKTKLPHHGPVSHSARQLAVEVLKKLDEEASYSDLLLSESLKTTSLSPPDKRLTTMLVYGVLRYRNQLDWFIEQISTRPMLKVSSIVKAILRSAVYQLLYLDRIPPAAVINEAVNLAHYYGHAGLAAYVNAVLRQCQRRRSCLRLPKEDSDPVKHTSLAFAHPEWMVARWIERFGLEECQRLCQANNQQSPLTIRLNSLKLLFENALDYLGEELVDLQPSSIVPEGFLVKGPYPLTATSSYHKGYFEIQGLSSMLVTRILDPQPGELILDACAGRGGKTTHVAQLMKNRGTIFALDHMLHKLKSLRENSQRLGIQIIHEICSDIKRQSFLIRFDRILVDAPCSSLGTLSKHPEIKWSKKESDLTELSSLQLSILENSSHLVKSNGILVYSTCSFEPEETTQVLNRFLNRYPIFTVEDLGPHLPKTLQPAIDKKGGYMYIYPHHYNLDGFFIVKLRKS